jgi:hypothetical protein
LFSELPFDRIDTAFEILAFSELYGLGGVDLLEADLPFVVSARHIMQGIDMSWMWYLSLVLPPKSRYDISVNTHKKQECREFGCCI